MEVDAAVDMFERSENLHNVKYIYYVGNGDSKTFKGIFRLKVFNFCVEVEELRVAHCRALAVQRGEESALELKILQKRKTRRKSCHRGAAV